MEFEEQPIIILWSVNSAGAEPRLENEWSCKRDGARHLSTPPLGFIKVYLKNNAITAVKIIPKTQGLRTQNVNVGGQIV